MVKTKKVTHEPQAIVSMMFYHILASSVVLTNIKIHSTAAGIIPRLYHFNMSKGTFSFGFLILNVTVAVK